MNLINNKKYNILIIFLVILIFIVLSGFIIGYLLLNNEKQTQESLEEKSKTIMLYIVGSDLESDAALATAELLEMEDANVDLSAYRIVVYMGGANNYYNDYVKTGENAILSLTENGFTVEDAFSSKNMGSSDTLSYFINYVTDHYTSDEYSLILWDHGGGPLIGYGQDETTNDILTLNEISSALSNTNFNRDNKLGFIGFDACLMASIEVAYLLNDYAHYLIASQETEPGFGWDYTFLSNLSANSTNEEIGKSIIDTYFEYSTTNNYTYDITLSMLNLNKVSQVEKELNQYFANVKEVLSNSTFTSFARKRIVTKTFGGFNSSTSYDLVDLYNMIDVIELNSSEYLKEAIKSLVVYNRSNVDNANGVSIYYPYSNKIYASSFINIYNSFDFATNYTSYINQFADILLGDRLKNLDISNSMPMVSSDDNYDFVLELTDDEANNYVEASYIVFRKTEDGFYESLYSGTDVDLDGNALRTKVRDKGVQVVSSNDETGNISLLEKERTSEYTNYFSPVMLTYFSDDVDDFEMNTMSGFLQIRMYNNGEIDVMGIVPNEELTSVAPKMLTNLDDWRTIQFLKFSYNIIDENGNYTTDWESNDTITGWELYIDEIESFQKLELSETDEYYCVFAIRDSQGNVSYSQLVPITR